MRTKLLKSAAFLSILEPFNYFPSQYRLEEEGRYTEYYGYGSNLHQCHACNIPVKSKNNSVISAKQTTVKIILIFRDISYCYKIRIHYYKVPFYTGILNGLLSA